MSDALDCSEGNVCVTTFTCADESGKRACGLDYISCITQHYHHQCAHKFDGPDVELPDNTGWSTSCSRCGMLAIYHDMEFAP